MTKTWPQRAGIPRIQHIFGRVEDAVSHFFFAPASPRPIAALRIGLAMLLIIQALLVRPVVLSFYAHNGLVQESLAPFFNEPLTPQIATFVQMLAPFGIGEPACIYALGLAYLASLVMMGIGWRTRLATTLAWFLHWMFMVSGSTSNYGVEIFAHVFLFLLIFMPAGAALSVDVWMGRTFEQATPLSRVCLRVLQIQLCISYLASGIAKAQGLGWWNGEALWKSLELPDYRQYDLTWLSHWPLLPMVGGWATILVEAGYCICIWPKATRRYWIAVVVALHMGIAVFLGLTLFGMIMCMLTLTIFGVPADASLSVALPRQSAAPVRDARAAQGGPAAGRAEITSG